MNLQTLKIKIKHFFNRFEVTTYLFLNYFYKLLIKLIQVKKSCNLLKIHMILPCLPKLRDLRTHPGGSWLVACVFWEWPGVAGCGRTCPWRLRTAYNWAASSDPLGTHHPLPGTPSSRTPERGEKVTWFIIFFGRKKLSSLKNNARVHSLSQPICEMLKVKKNGNSWHPTLFP